MLPATRASCTVGKVAPSHPLKPSVSGQEAARKLAGPSPFLNRGFSRRSARFRYHRPGLQHHIDRMMPFDKLDAFKVCHALTLELYKTAQAFEARDAGLAGELALAALIASSRIARGTGFRNRRMFCACLERSHAALSEISYFLNMARAFDFISADVHQDLESQRGRAAFYVMKLLLAGVEPPPPSPSS
jgi:four helix bundle protein